MKDRAKALSNDLRLAEQFILDLVSKNDLKKVGNKINVIAEAPKSPNSKKLRRIYKNLDICKD